MALVSLVLELDAVEADALSDKLLELGAPSVTTEDAAAGTDAEKAIFDEPGEDPTSWQRLRMRVLADDADQGRALLARAGAALGMAGLADAAIEIVEDLDWVRVTQAQFEPQRISSRCSLNSAAGVTTLRRISCRLWRHFCLSFTPSKETCTVAASSRTSLGSYVASDSS